MADENVTIRTKLQGASQYIRDSYAAAAATAKIGAAAETTARSMSHATHRTFLYNQAIFTMRRYLYAGTLALTAAAGGAALFGLKFDTSMEKVQVGFETLLGSQQAAKDEINFLFELAAKTPFEFEPLTEVARKFVAFGMSVGDTNKTLTATADAVSALGGSQDSIDRIIIALGQMQVKGRVTGEELRQLYNANIPASKYLERNLGLTKDQLANIARLRIPAGVGIQAIIKGMEQDYGGSAKRLAGTVSGQLSTFHDYAQRLMGDIMLAPFQRIKKEFPGVLTAIQAMSDAMNNKGFMAMVAAFDNAVGAGGKLSLAVQILANFFGSLWETLTTKVIPAIWPFAVAAGAAVLVIAQLTSWVLDFINLGGTPLVWILRLLVLWWVTETLVMKINVMWTKRAIFWERIMAFWIKRKTFALMLATLATGRNTAATVFNYRAVAQSNYNARMGIVANAGLTASIKAATVASWGFVVSLLANPITWIVLGLVVLTAALVVAYYKFERVRIVVQKLWDLLKSFGNWLSNHKDVFNIIPGVKQIGQIGGGIGHLLGLHDEAQAAVTPKLPSFGLGGGPQGVQLPGNKMVDPRMLDMAALTGGGGIHVTVVPQKIELDGRQIAEVVWKHKLDRFARR